MANFDLTGVWERIEDWYRLHAPQNLQILAPGASDAEIASLEAVVGLPLPYDYRQSLTRHNGGGFIQGSDYLDIQWAQRKWERMNAYAERGLFADLLPDDMSGNKFAPVWWSSKWLPVAEHRAGTLTCLDLAPGAGGAMGQVLQLNLRDEGPAVTPWNSFAEWLNLYCNELEDGKYDVDEYGNLNRRTD